MARKKNGVTDNLNAQSPDGEDNVDKIREILFGGQMRDYEERFQALEQRVSEALEQMSQQLTQQIEIKSKHIEGELDKVVTELNVEKQARASTAQNQESGLSAVKDQLAENLSDIENQLTNESETLRTALFDQSEDLAAQLRETQDQISLMLQNEIARLGENKLGRADMAALLSEFASKLTDNDKPSSK